MKSMLRSAFLSRLAHTLLGLWIGAMIAQAFIAAPLVFGSVPAHLATKDAAARVIGPGFGRIDSLGLLALIVLLGVYLAHGQGRRWRAWVAVVLLLGAAADCFFVAPMITTRSEPQAVYHGVAVTLWMVAILAGLVLLLAPRTTDRG